MHMCKYFFSRVEGESLHGSRLCKSDIASTLKSRCYQRTNWTMNIIERLTWFICCCNLTWLWGHTCLCLQLLSFWVPFQADLLLGTEFHRACRCTWRYSENTRTVQKHCKHNRLYSASAYARVDLTPPNQLIIHKNWDSLNDPENSGRAHTLFGF